MNRRARNSPEGNAARAGASAGGGDPSTRAGVDQGQTSEGARAGNTVRRSNSHDATQTWGASATDDEKSATAARSGTDANPKQMKQAQKNSAGGATFSRVALDCLMRFDSTILQPSAPQCASAPAQPKSCGRKPADSNAQCEVAGIQRRSKKAATIVFQQDMSRLRHGKSLRCQSARQVAGVGLQCARVCISSHRRAQYMTWIAEIISI